MVGKEVGRIREIVDYFSQKTKKEVLPVVQVRDFPESLKDDLSAEELNQTIQEALRLPSSGAILFTLNHLLESEKEKLIKFEEVGI